jgi:hypothetical protein
VLVSGRLLAALTPWVTGGSSLNFLYGETTPDQVRGACDLDAYRRLTELKAAYDPANLFRLNHNIPPRLPWGTMVPTSRRRWRRPGTNRWADHRPEGRRPTPWT